MGTWKSERGKVSDYMIDILNEAFNRIAKYYTLNDLADGIQFTTFGYLRVKVNPKVEGALNISELDNELGTMPITGQIRRKKNENINGNASVQ